MKTKILSVVAAVGLLVGGAATAQSTTEIEGEAWLRALLQEMRALRLTIQRNAAYEVRAQVLLDRARMQQQSVRELEQQVRGYEDNVMMSEEPFEIYEEEVAERLRTTNDPEQRRMIQRELSQIEKRKEMEAKRREQVQVHQMQLRDRLAEERAKLEGIQDELVRLEREIAGNSGGNSTSP